MHSPPRASWQLVDVLLEEFIVCLVVHTVYYLAYCENASNDCAQVDQELENVLFLVWVEHRHLADTVVEDDYWFASVV